MIYKDVLIEKEDTGKIELNKRGPVLLDHNATVGNFVGMAEDLREENGEIKATLHSFGNENFAGLYPSVNCQIVEAEVIDGVRYIKKMKLLGVGVHREPNADPSIPPIGNPEPE